MNISAKSHTCAKCCHEHVEATKVRLSVACEVKGYAICRRLYTKWEETLTYSARWNKRQKWYGKVWGLVYQCKSTWIKLQVLQNMTININHIVTCVLSPSHTGNFCCLRRAISVINKNHPCASAWRRRFLSLSNRNRQQACLISMTKLTVCDERATVISHSGYFIQWRAY